MPRSSNEGKAQIKGWVEQNSSMDFPTKSELLQFIYDYDSLTLNI